MKTNWSSVLTKIDADILRTERHLAELHAARESLLPLMNDAGKKAGVAAKLPKIARSGAKKSAAKASRARNAAAKLPATGSEFWLNVLGKSKRTGREIVDLAMAELKLGDEDRNAIYSRAANWFNGAVKKSLVQIVEQRDGVNVYQRV